MPDPPNPGVPPLLVQLLARLVWAAVPGAFDPTGLALGAFGTSALYMTTGDVWASGPLAPTSPAMGPFLCSERTATIIQHGTIATDGALVYGGARYRIQAICASGCNIARAVEVA